MPEGIDVGDYSDTNVKPLRVLIIDDDAHRFAGIVAWLTRNERMSDTTKRKIDVRWQNGPSLFGDEYEMVFLDHDLGSVDLYRWFRGFQPGNYKRGIRPQEKPEIIIHSMNPVGAQNLKTELEYHGFVHVSILPYSQMQKEIA